MAPKSSIDSWGVNPNVNAPANRVFVSRGPSAPSTRKPEERKYWPCSAEAQMASRADLGGRYVIEADLARSATSGTNPGSPFGCASPALVSAGRPSPRGSPPWLRGGGLPGAEPAAARRPRDATVRAAGGGGGCGAGAGGGVVVVAGGGDAGGRPIAGGIGSSSGAG